MTDLHLTDEQAEELKSMGPLGEEAAYALWLWGECPAAPWAGISLASIFRTEFDKNEQFLIDRNFLPVPIEAKVLIKIHDWQHRYLGFRVIDNTARKLFICVLRLGLRRESRLTSSTEDMIL